jgi:phosphomethylpyrimidine synthase
LPPWFFRLRGYKVTLLEQSRKEIITPRIREVALQEGLEAETIRQGIADGTIVIPANINHSGVESRGVGKGLSTKVNANIGTSSDFIDLDVELTKLDVAIKAGADASWT